MKKNNYRRKFKPYLDDLEKKGLQPGGGSAGVLAFCLGSCLIIKSIRHSLVPGLNKNKKKKLASRLAKISYFKKNIYPVIDSDGELFSRMVKSNGAEKVNYFYKTVRLVKNTAHSAEKVFLLAKEIEFDIKKSIKSDFYLGLEFIKLSLFSAISNLEENNRMFGRKDKHLANLKKSFKKMKAESRWEKL